MATVRKRNDQWQDQVRVKGHPAESRSFPTRSHGVAWGKQREEELRQGTLSAKGHTLRGLFALYGKDASPVSQTFLRTLERRADFLDLPLDRITKAHWHSYRTLALKTQKPSS